MSGYTDCACRDCFEISMGGLCNACEEAGCEGGESECEAPHAYGGETTCPCGEDASIINRDGEARCGGCHALESAE